MEQFRGWGRGARQAVAKWYNDKDPEQLAYQMVKYKQRDGWSHRDLLRLSHPKAPTKEHEALYAWVAEKITNENYLDLPDVVKAAVTLSHKINYVSSFPVMPITTIDYLSDIVALIKEHNLPRECIPTHLLKEKLIWEALLENMPMTAMIRNLGNLGKVGLLVPGAFDVIDKVTSQLTSMDALRKARIHPLSVLVAMNTYSSGHGYRGSGEWPVVGDVTDALDSAFYKAFDVVEPTGKRICIGLDVSGSMGSGEINGIPGMTPRVGACAMSMVTYKVEPRVSVMAFCDTFVPIDMSRHRRLDDLVTYTNSLPFGGTDCSLPITWALNMWRQRPTVTYDAFIIYTDNETWAGDMHPKQALDIYRQKVNPEAKLVVVGMTATDISIADPTDPGMLDVVGFDTAAPNIISQFIK
jgi:60 kDa SS-A/Ro ribonucleoprotein